LRKYYVGLDVHKLTIAIAVLDAQGKFVSRTVIQTSTAAVRDSFRHLRGETARTCIGPSTVRGRANAGAVVASRNFLRLLYLAPFGVADRAAFETELNQTTDAATAAHPRSP
jgi:hypothetical protein